MNDNSPVNADPLVLGLDLGTNSIGWALFRAKGKAMLLQEIVALGVRIFDQVTDDKTGAPKNQARRAARLRRRGLYRRKSRRNELRKLLIDEGYLPTGVADDRTAADLFNRLGDPYQLRAEALSRPLNPHELGRVLLHLIQRRGFKSNRKTDRADKDAGKIKHGIARLKEKLATEEAATLGAFLARQDNKRFRLPAKITEASEFFYADRALYEEEFDQIVRAQSTHHAMLLSGKTLDRIRHLLYFQKPLKEQKSLLGECQFERHRPRCAMSRLEAQEFRALQTLNNLRVMTSADIDFVPLTNEQRKKLLPELYAKARITWNRVRSLLNLAKTDRLNLEEGGLKELPGQPTAVALAKALGGRTWDKFPEDRKLALVEDLNTIADTAALQRRLKTAWGFEETTVAALLELTLPDADRFSRLSLKAIKKLLPALRDGKTYAEAAHDIYGHNMRQIGPVVRLLPEPPNVRNPVVNKALYELRKVVNAIVRTHGIPNLIRVELARDMKMSARQRQESQAEQLKRAKERDAARKVLQDEFKINKPSRSDIEKYLLWNELVEANGGLCPYTGIVIREMLFTPAIDIEHILPYSRSLDNSFANKTLCEASYNRLHKRGRTPLEAVGGDLAKLAEILARVKRLPKGKYRRFTFGATGESKSNPEKEMTAMAQRQLQDTRYLSVLAKDYLAQLGCGVQTSTGGITAGLRHQWGLNSLLNPEAHAPQKNREDHRHHAIDAAVVASVTHAIVHRIQTACAQAEQNNLDVEGRALWHSKLEIVPPWKEFRADLAAAVEGIIVSHAPTRAVRGALHKDTAYGRVIHPQTGQPRFHVRKRLADLTEPMLKAIADPAVGAIVRDFFALHGLTGAKARIEAGDFPLHKDGATPIKKVRIDSRETPTGLIGVPLANPISYYAKGSNHHLELFENQDTGAWTGRLVSTFEAAQRARLRQPLIDRHPPPGHRFVMSLHPNDMLETKDVDQARIYRIQKLSQENNGSIRIVLREHSVNLTTDEGNVGILRKTPNSFGCLNPIKISLSPTGKIYYVAG